MDVSLIVPTINRSEYVIKMIKYYRDTGFRGQLLIGDSSEPAHVERTKRAIKELNAPFKIVYCECPGQTVFEVIRGLLPRVSTSYVMWIPDDDLLVPGALQECIRFLDKNPEYSAVGGVAVLFKIPTSTAGDETLATRKYWVREIENVSAADRLQNLLRNYSVVGYAVSRLEQFKKRYLFENDLRFADPGFGNELFCVCMLAVQGRIKMIERLFLVRQIHDQRYLFPDALDWITNENWFPSYLLFRDRLAKEIANLDGISIGAAQNVVKQAFWVYLGKRLSRGLKKPSATLRMRGKLRHVPGLKKVWQAAKAFIPTRSDGLSLSALLKPYSKYHADFMPIYRVLTHSSSYQGES